jgi:hypothetical protein
MAKRRQTTTGSLYLRRRFQRILREGGVEALIEEYEKRAQREGGDRWHLMAKILSAGELVLLTPRPGRQET